MASDVRGELERLRAEHRKMAVLFRVVHTISSELNLKRLLLLIMDEVKDILEADRCTVYILDRRRDDLWMIAAHGLRTEEFRFPRDRGIVGHVATTGETVNLANAYEDPRFNREIDQRTGYRTHSVLTMPLQNKRGEIIGVFQVLNKRGGGRFTKASEELLKAISIVVATQIENAQLHESELEKQRLEEELALARQIQQRLLPKVHPTVSGYRMAGINRPARQVSGDYYDFIRVDDARWGVAIADVAGKGVPAALLMSNLQATLRALAYEGMTPADIAGRINHLICENTDVSQFITFFYGLLASTGQFTYTNAGHNPPIWIHADESCHLLETGGPLLGVFSGIPYAQQTIQLRPGDRIVLYTDGITEAMNAQEEEFGLHRLRRALRVRSENSLQGVLEWIEENVRRFSGDLPQEDDMTLVVVEAPRG